ncbi:MAG: CopG family transcriptional regulator [Succinivibrionaceae bacterium]|nr:CopG family transcriptional regulator [Succinivibrionaceae bacterium]
MSVKFSVRLDEQLKADLDTWAAERHVSQTKAIEQAVDELLHPERRAAKQPERWRMWRRVWRKILSLSTPPTPPGNGGA